MNSLLIIVCISLLHPVCVNSMTFTQLADQIVDQNITNQSNTKVINVTLRDNIASANNTIFSCVKASDCNFNGYCSDNNQCICNKYFTTTDPMSPCNYERKLQYPALLLTIFLGFCGGGNFYNGRLEYAIPQLIIFLIVISIICCRVSHGNDNHDEIIDGFYCFILILPILCILGWWLADVIRYAQNNVNDKNDISLASW